MKEDDIRRNVDLVLAGILRDSEPAPMNMDQSAQHRWRNETAKIEAAGKDAAAELVIHALGSLGRIADAHEQIAHVLEAGGPFAIMREAKPLFDEAPHSGDH